MRVWRKRFSLGEEMLALGRRFFRSSNTHRVFSYIIVCAVSRLLDFWEAGEIVVSEAMIFRSLNTLTLRWVRR